MNCTALARKLASASWRKLTESSERGLRCLWAYLGPVLLLVCGRGWKEKAWQIIQRDCGGFQIVQSSAHRGGGLGGRPSLQAFYVYVNNIGLSSTSSKLVAEGAAKASSIICSFRSRGLFAHDEFSVPRHSSRIGPGSNFGARTLVRGVQAVTSKHGLSACRVLHLVDNMATCLAFGKRRSRGKQILLCIRQLGALVLCPADFIEAAENPLDRARDDDFDKDLSGGPETTHIENHSPEFRSHLPGVPKLRALPAATPSASLTHSCSLARCSACFFCS